jgi:hypothetical protein
MYGHLYHARLIEGDKESVMEPRFSVCRKGDDIFLTIEGEVNHGSSQELFWMVRQLVMTSLKYIVPGSQMTYSFKARGKVDLEKLAQFQQEIHDQTCCKDACEATEEKQEQEVVLVQVESPKGQPNGRLILVKGGAF